MSTKDFLNIGLETTKGSALHSLKDEGAVGTYDFSILDVSGVAVDAEVFTLGDDVYEVHAILTDTGAESVAQVEVGDTTISFDTAPSIPLTNGAVIRMESEYMIVIEVNLTGNTSVHVVRGAFGSTEAVHSIANSDTFQAAQLVSDDNFAVPTDDVAAAAFVVDCAAAVQFWTDGGYSKGLGGGIGVTVENGLKVDAFIGVADSVIFALDANKAGPAVATEGFTNGTITAFGGGVEKASQVYVKIVHVAADANDVVFVAPWAVDSANAIVMDSTGVQLAWDGTVVVVGGRLVTVNNGGVVDFAVDDTIILHITKA